MNDITVIVPVPVAAPPLDVKLKIGGTWRPPDDAWPYRDPSGVLGYECRWNKEDGSKESRIATWCQDQNGRGHWRLKSWSDPRPLYNLDRFLAHRSAKIYVVEGPKTVTAAEKIFPEAVVTTSPHGAGSAHKADWAVCKDRDIVIVPDVDLPGETYAKEVIRLAEAAGARSIARINTSSLAAETKDGLPRMPPKGWDLADALEEGWELVALREAILTLETRVESLSDRIETLITRARDGDAGAPFETDGLDDLISLEDQNEPQFQRIWARFGKNVNRMSLRAALRARRIQRSEQEAAPSMRSTASDGQSGNGAGEKVKQSLSLEEQAALDQIAAIDRAYPLPRLPSRDLRYDRALNGKIFAYEGSRPLASPFTLPARLVCVDADQELGTRLVIENVARQPQAVDIARCALVRSDGAEARAQLLSAGMTFAEKGDLAVVEFLKAVVPDKEIRVLSKTGWHVIPDSATLVFVGPDGRFLGGSGFQDLELTANVTRAPGVVQAGTIEEWSAAIEVAASVEHTPHWMLGLIVGFAGVLVDLTRLDTCGINLVGLSSVGKSLAQEIAVSPWTTPSLLETGLNLSAHMTENAVERPAFHANGTVLALDELGMVENAKAARLIFAMAGGQDKRRLRASGDLQKRHTWRTVVLTSCETTLSEKVKAGGLRWTLGMAARFSDVDVSGVNKDVDPESIRQIEAIRRHYGHAGPRFVKGLIADGLHKKPRQLLSEIYSDAVVLAADCTDGGSRRAALKFAVLSIAGNLARRYGLVPSSVDVEQVIYWAWDRFRESSSAAVMHPIDYAVEHLRAWILRRWNSTIRQIGSQALASRDAEGWYNEHYVYIPVDKLEEAAGGQLSRLHLCQSLRDKNHLDPGRSDRLVTEYVPGLGYLKVFALKRSEYGNNSMLRGSAEDVA